MSFDDLVDWQRRDAKTGLVQPWFTHGALDEIQNWDLGDKVVLEWGGGHSTLWWSDRCRHVFTIDTNPEWGRWINSRLRKANVVLKVFDVDPAPLNEYTAIPDGCNPDIVVVDGIYRTQCLEASLKLRRPLRVICDNWQQDFVYLCDRAVALMAPYRSRVYVQPGHTAHEGRPWKTAIWDIE